MSKPIENISKPIDNYRKLENARSSRGSSRKVETLSGGWVAQLHCTQVMDVMIQRRQAQRATAQQASDG